ncbi:MAG: S8 family serine peptidase [Pseudomonadota bacterium]
MAQRTLMPVTKLNFLAALLATTAWASACVAVPAETEPTAAPAPEVTETAAPAEPKPVIASIEDMPRFAYEIDLLPSELLVSDRLLSEYGPLLRADTKSVLDTYEISDPATESGLIGDLAILDLLEGDPESVIAYVAEMTALAEKPAEKYTTAMFTDTLAKARLAGREVSDVFAEKLAAMPFAVVQENVESAKGSLEVYSENLVLGMVQGQFDDGALDRGSISKDVLSTLIRMRYLRDLVVPNKDAMIAPLAAYIEANAVEKPNIWPAREVDLTGAENLSEVVVVAWDSGVDVPLFETQLWQNPKEAKDGTDTDGNGFVDDVNGIAFDIDGDKTSLLLQSVDALNQSEADVRGDIKGWLDNSANVNSDESSAIKAKIANFEPDEVQPFFEDLSLYANYSHGTHVAGIMLEGNPAARLMTARLTFDYRMKPAPYLEANATKDAAAMRETVAYFQANGARIVNMSWGGSPEAIEYTLEVNNIETDPDKRRARAYAIFEIMKSALEEAIIGAPEILFIAAAGNSDGDASFSNFYPSGIIADNLITVGAVDQAGDETGFTSYGPTVVLHANGYEVNSEVPGGFEMPFSGTSMAAPNAANLAGKMLAIDPSLSVADLIGIMRDTADTTEDGRRFLIHPVDAIAAVQARTG